MSDEVKGNGPVLPVMGTLLSAAASLFQLRVQLLKALLLPLGISVVLGLVFAFIAPSLPGALFILIVFTLFFVTAALFAIPCHRVVLGRAPDDSTGWVVFHGGNVTRYAFTLLGLSVIALIIALPIGIPLAFSDYPSLAKLASLPTAYVFARLSLSLPAAAVSDPLNLDGAWDVSRGNGWRLAIVVVLVPWLITLPLQLVPGDSVPLWIVGVALLVQFVAAVYGFVALSESYRALGAKDWRPEEIVTAGESR